MSPNSQNAFGFTSLGRSAERGFTSLWRSAEHGFTSLWRSAEHGFTLIEMMVALAIFSLAAVALVRLQGATVRNASTVEAQAMAQIVANNLAVEAMTEPTLSIGKSDGNEQNGGRQWRWRRTIAKTADPAIVRVDIAVADTGGRTLSTLTLARMAR